jgi:hypothetical protein
MHTEQVETLFPSANVAAQIDAAYHGHGAVSRESIPQRLLRLMGFGRRVVVRSEKRAAVQRATNEAAVADDNVPEPVSQGSITQINDSDRAYLNVFPPERKAKVMETIMSLTPVQTVVCQGNTQLEKAVLNFHRGGYGLIDMQALENAFTSVWYRKNASFLGKGADVTMLLWEYGENGDAVTTMSWKI